MSLSAQVTLNVSPDQLDALNELADAKGITKASLVRLALASYFGQNGYDFPGRTL